MAEKGWASTISRRHKNAEIKAALESRDPERIRISVGNLVLRGNTRKDLIKKLPPGTLGWLLRIDEISGYLPKK